MKKPKPPGIEAMKWHKSFAARVTIPLLIWLLLWSFVLWVPCSAVAGPPALSVFIVNDGQYGSPPDKKSTLSDRARPVFEFPLKSKAGTYDMDKPTGWHFYVVVQNISSHPVPLNFAASDWFNCLEFTLTLENGKVFSIHRPRLGAWSNNPSEPWVFPPGGLKIIPIDFTSGIWEGFPSRREVPDDHPIRVKAIFLYDDYGMEGGEALKVESKSVAAILRRP